eukprot:349898-Chlamydomonas_euryale.AAC.1
MDSTLGRAPKSNCGRGGGGGGGNGLLDLGCWRGGSDGPPPPVAPPARPVSASASAPALVPGGRSDSLSHAE